MTDRHGCYNRKPFAGHYEAQNGWWSSRERRMAIVTHTMSRDCQHPERATDPRCAGCKWVTMTDEQVRAER